MKRAARLKKELEEKRPAAYDALPDIDLYKDQVLSYMPRQLTAQQPEEALTGAMINNYIKSGLLPRPQGKRYDRRHLSYLTAICQLKQLLSVDQTDRLLKAQWDLQDAPLFYERYCALLDKALRETAQKIDSGLNREETAALALELCLEGYARQQAALSLLCAVEAQLQEENTE